MKKKWLSMLLSCALLASSVLPSFTAVAADRGGADAAPAPTAAVEEAAPVAEEAAPAAEAAPVALETADVPAATASGDKVVEQDGKRYHITIAQDFEDATNDYIGATNGNVSIVDNQYNGTKSASYNSGNNFTTFKFKLDSNKISGDGLYFEVITDDKDGIALSGQYNLPLVITRSASGSVSSSDTYYYKVFDTDFNGNGKRSFGLPAGDYSTTAYGYFVPWTDFYHNTSSNNSFDENAPILNVNSFNAGTEDIWVSVTWNQAAPSNQIKFNGTYLYFDNFGFYEQTHAVSTYTTWQNPLATPNTDAVTSDGDEFNVAVSGGTATFTMKADTMQWNHRMFLALDPTKLTNTGYIEFDLSVGSNVPEDLLLTFQQTSSYDRGGTLVSSSLSGVNYKSGTGRTYHYKIPISDFNSGANLSSATWLRVNFATNATFNLFPTGSNSTFAFSNLKILESDTFAFDYETPIVNVKPTVAEGGTLDVAVDEESNGGHAINWEGLDHTANPSLQVKSGASVTLTAHPAEGMRTVWTGVPNQGEKVQNDTVTFNATEGAAPSATFEEIPKYTVTIEKAVYQKGEADIPVPGAPAETTQTVTEDEELTLDVASYEGFTFERWHVNPIDHASEVYGKANTYTITGEVKFTPYYTEDMRTVKAVKDRESTAEEGFWTDKAGITSEYEVQLEAAVAAVAQLVPEGQKFAGWDVVEGTAKINGEGAEATSITLESENVVIVPKYEAITPVDPTKITIKGAVDGLESGNVTIAADGGDSSIDSLTVNPNTKVTLTAPEDTADKKFSHWVRGTKQDGYILSYERKLEVIAKGSEGDAILYTAVYVPTSEVVTPAPTLNVYSQTKNDDSVVVVFEWRDAPAKGLNVGEVVLKIVGSAGGVQKDLVSYNVKFENGYYTLTVTFGSGSVPDDFTLTATLTTKDSGTAQATAEFKA